MSTIITCPFEPIPELQSEDGVLLYLSKLSKLSPQELCSELSNVMAAKHNQMIHPAGLNEYQQKQTIVTDLTDKATAICMHQFGQASVIGAFGSDLRQLNELINTLDEQVAQHDLEPEQHGAMLLEKLAEILRPETREDENEWLEDLLSDTSDQSVNDSYELLKEAPFIIFILMALADGEIDLKETTALAEVVLKPEMFGNDFLVQLIRDAIPQITEKSIPECLSSIMNENPDYEIKLQEIRKVIDEHLDSESALEFKKSLIKLGYKIADASGGLFGFGSRVCKQEKEMLKAIASILGVTGV